MPLVALLFAHHLAPGSNEPLAALGVAGLAVIERQVTLARRLGAKRILVIAERMPPGLAAALVRIGGLVTVLRSAAAIADEIGGGDLVLTFQEGLMVDPDVAAMLVGEEAGALLAVTAGEAAYGAAERLDSQSFWAGFAIYEGDMVKRVAADIGEWDLQSTLLRAAAVGGAPRVELRIEPRAWRFAGDSGAAAAISTQLVTESRRRRFGWPSRFLFGPLHPRVIDGLLPTRLTGRMLTAGGVGAGILASLLFATGWLWPAAIIALLAPQLCDVGSQLARLRLEPEEGWFDRIYDWFVEPSWYLALALWLAGQGQGEVAWVTAASAILFRLAMVRQSSFYRRMKGSELEAEEPRVAAFAAGRDSAPWLILVAGVAGLWIAGLGAIAVHAAISFFALQARLFARLADRSGARL